MTGFPSIYDVSGNGGGGGGVPDVPADNQVYGFRNNGSTTTSSPVVGLSFPAPGFTRDPFGTEYGLQEPQNGFTPGFVQTVNLAGSAQGSFYGGRFNFAVPDNTYFEIGVNGGPDVVNMLLIIASSTDFSDPSISAIQAQFADRGAVTTATPDNTWIMLGQALNTTSAPSGVNLPFETGEMRIGFEKSGSNVWAHINGTKTIVHDNLSEFAHVTMGVIPAPGSSTTSGVFGIYSGTSTTEESTFESGVTKLDLSNLETQANPVVAAGSASAELLSVTETNGQYVVDYTGPVYRGAEVFVNSGTSSSSIVPSLGTPINLTATHIQAGEVQFEFDGVNDTEFMVAITPVANNIGDNAVINFVRGAATHNPTTNRVTFSINRLQYSGGSNNRQAGEYFLNILSRVS